VRRLDRQGFNVRQILLSATRPFIPERKKSWKSRGSGIIGVRSLTQQFHSFKAFRHRLPAPEPHIAPAVEQASVLTIDTNPAPAFTRSSRNAASSQRLLPARQALRHEAEEFGLATPPAVGPRHGLKPSKSVENPQQVKVIGKASLGSSKRQFSAKRV
jgi:hypothetical protein